ncbi:MAG: hypothetical protein J7K75_07595, partial [Desulfuromonas sp.]|nr:hypothetical protein [Desulfuromonas sp.]
MKKIALMLLMMVCISGTAMAGEKFSLDVGVDYSSRYIWRGMDLINDDNGAVQPWFDAGYSITDKLSIHYLFWADYRLVDGDYDFGDDNEWDEFDHIGYLTYDINDTLSCELGYIYYYLPENAWGDTNNDQEFYGGISAALTDNLSTSLYVYYNFDSGSSDGIYAKWAFDGAMALTETAELFASAGIGYMDYEDDFDSGFSDLPVSAGVSVDLGRGLGMYVSANYSVTLDALRDNDINHENEAWVMTGLSYSL